MSHFITVPINENGIVFSSDMNLVVQEAMLVDPFGFSDVFVYSHGWGNDSAVALDEYNRFSVDLAKKILEFRNLNPGLLTRMPGETLGVGIHWPSEITEDPGSPLNNLQLLTFYTMEHRADSVGRNAVYIMLRLILSSRVAPAPPVRISLLGHSFGCKVVLAALDELQADIANNTIPMHPDTEFQVVLLEPATDFDNLEPGDIYGRVNLLPVRILMTTSQLDYALTRWYVAAGRLANLLKAPRQALGASGPSAPTSQAFGGATNVSIAPGFTATSVPGGGRLLVADLTPVHQARVNLGPDQGGYAGGLQGSHSDINFAEIYQLVCGFLFG
jgi:hypothetical protein